MGNANKKCCLKNRLSKMKQITIKKIGEVKKKTNVLIGIILINLVIIIFLTNFFLENVKAGGIFEWMLVSIFLLFFTPLFIIRNVFKQKLGDYFLKSQLNTRNSVVSFLGIIAFVAVMGILVVKLNWQESLRISSWTMAKDVKLILFVDLFILPIVIFTKEFFFRGYIMKTLSSIMGVYIAIIAQAFLFLVYEIGTTGMISGKSMILIIIPNILFGFIAYKNNSIFASTVVHWVYLLILDIYFYFRFTS
jgi:membrane protease YdiL (CAAX protease family)